MIEPLDPRRKVDNGGPCPSCKAELDAAVAVADDAIRPTPGSITVCGYCGAILVFAEGGGYRTLDLPLAGKFDRETRVQLAAMSALFFVLGRKPPSPTETAQA